MAYEDLVAQFESFTNPGADVTPDIDTVLSGVTEVYNQDISIRDHAVKDREEQILKLQNENGLLKNKNYDLLMKQPAGNVSGDNNPPEPDEHERAATVTFADIFKK